MTALSYVIESCEEFDDETEEPLFWSNQDGWVFFSTATRFTKEEALQDLSLPLGRCQWVVLQETLT